MPHRLLLIEDDDSFSRRLSANLTGADFQVQVAVDGAAAFKQLRHGYFDLVITDIRLPDIDGLEILRAIKEGRDNLDATMPVVVLTSVRDIETAVGAMRDGAADFITKECEKPELLLRLERVLEQSAILNENRYLRDQLASQSEFGEMVGESPAMRQIKTEIADLAGADITVLVTGETGVGKELVARALHATGKNPDGPFVELNCAALPDENLLLSELFGHERGAFTGAVSLRRGKFEQARGGTLFLDEIGEMPLGAQSRVLKTIEQLRVTRLGGTSEIEVDCRLVFATNRDLEQEVAEGTFRKDLYYRINLMPLHIPPLRERRGDIELLARTFLNRFCEKYSRMAVGFDASALAVLRACSWPGNVRELRNVVERLAIRSRNETLSVHDLERCGVGPDVGSSNSIDIPKEGLSLEHVEMQLVTQALERTNWNQKQAAGLLGISVDRMHTRVKKFGLTHRSWRVNR